MSTQEKSIDLREGKYGCFLHPQAGHDKTAMDAPCPSCGRPYSFPLTTPPTKVGPYVIEKPLSRGFYGAIYKASSGRLGKPCVLKIIPVEVYAFFGKDFEKECRLHDAVAAGTDHLVGISDFSVETVKFGDVEIECHVAILDYVDGVELTTYLDKSATNPVSARALAQLSVDLFRLLHELEQKEAYHNDLHGANLLVRALPQSQYRVEAIDETVQLVAVDLGSLADRSRSGERGRVALGDLGSVASFLQSFAEALLADPDRTQDSDYRLALVLAELASMMAGTAANIRTPDYEDFIAQIRQAYMESASPWHPPAGLHRLNDAYNAQTLHPFFVPRLLVDPGGEWLSAVSTSGPQVITGVRGCGKTMLLRALQFHARLSTHAEAGADIQKISAAVRSDGYVGLYLSARRLLDAVGRSTKESLHEPYARLLVGYAREAVRAGRHLQETVRGSMFPRWWQPIAQAVSASLLGDGGQLLETVSPQVLERRLQAVLFSLDRGETTYKLVANPAIAFPALAESVLGATSVWGGCKVLYLLDDVSTRHLEEQGIAELLGTLLFSDERCAFKLTTEGQTLELALKSPGLVERARADRDYEPFDLAARVNETLKDPRRGKQFLAEILQLRASQFHRHPSASPADLLGDASLESIARQIVSTNRTAAERKETYHGLTALAAVCVGDIGDVLNIYESILRKAGDRQDTPIAPSIQNSAFQEYSSRRLYHLNRRNGDLKDVAMAFAKAAHELLLRSAKTPESPTRGSRLRQYVQLYVRITAGDEKFQFEKLRELIDAGVFVLESGSDSPRTKTRDSNPMSQFILTYRKLFGLSQYIGLAFSDRFELSGEQLEAWLKKPADGREILLKNLGGPLTEAEAVPVEELPSKNRKAAGAEAQISLALLPSTPELDAPADNVGPRTQASSDSRWKSVAARIPRVQELGEDDIVGLGVKSLVLGMGFEDRCLESTKRLLARFGGQLESAVLVRYGEPGHGVSIERLLREKVSNVRVVDYASNRWGHEDILPPGKVALDVTGLAKPAIFSTVRSALLRDRAAVVIHTGATQHYPLDEDIAKVFDGADGSDEFEILRRAGALLSGESTPYSFVPLLASDAEDSRPLLLCAAASAKHERLLSLMDERAYEAADIVVPVAQTPRTRLAVLAAEVATRGVDSAKTRALDSNDVGAMLDYLAARYREFYVDGGFSIEIGLTGSKMHAVAAAAATSVFKVSQVWYVSPTRFDSQRFTRGIGRTRFIQLSI
jgi:hypothetical protein